MAERNSRPARSRKRSGSSRGEAGGKETSAAGVGAAETTTRGSSPGTATGGPAPGAGDDAEAGAEPIVIAERITVIAEAALPDDGGFAAGDATAGSDTRFGTGPAQVTAEQRYLLIAERAYERARERGFEPGGELEDWLLAEREIDARLAGGG